MVDDDGDAVTRTAADDTAAPGVGSDDDVVGTLAVFSVLWALAAMWHVFSAPVLATPGTQYVLALGIAAVLAYPGAPAVLAVLSVGVLATLWDEAPTAGNHWVLAGFVSIAILVCQVSAPRNRALFARRLLPVVRACWLAFYSFAAFAKLNSSFFDRAVSCGVVYFRESTDSIGLGALQLGGNAGVEWAVIVGTAAIELSIPVLLLVRRTRSWGVVVALVFHGVLALDRAHSFTDFSALLAALFVLFLPAASVAQAARLVTSKVEEYQVTVRAISALVPAGLVASIAARRLDPDLLVELRWWTWQFVAVGMIGVVGVHVWRARPVAEPAALRPRPVALLLVPALVAFNGVTPYLEVKTSYSWNMYANLRTVDGESNHFIVRRTLHLSHEQDDLVRIVESDNPGLQEYADRDVVLTWRTLRAYVAARPDIALTYERGGEVVTLEHADDDPALVTAPPEWRQKVQPFRAVDGGEPERCQTSFLPAG